MRHELEPGTAQLRAIRACPSCARRDEEFSKLHGAWSEVLDGMARRYARNRSDQPDFVQIGALALLRAAQRYRRKRGRFENYARRAIRHAMLDEVERQGKAAVIRTSRAIEFGYAKEDYLDGVMRKETVSVVRNEVQTWEPRLRSIVDDVYGKGLPQAAVARRLGLTPARVNQLLRKIEAQGKAIFVTLGIADAE